MPFTDDDLKRLKSEIPDDDSCHQICIKCGYDIESLLARLEAAEAVIHWQDQYDQTFDVQEEVSYTPLAMLESSKIEWRKAKGELGDSEKAAGKGVGE